MNKKGFTLIELLSVIIILGVIALITTPIVLEIVESSKEQARMQSVIGYADAVKLSFIEEESNKTGTSLEELANSKMQGSEVKCDVLQYNKNYGTVLHGCKVSENNTEKGNYCYINGNVYNIGSTECDNVLNIAQNGTIEHKTPNITVISKTPSDTDYSQSKQISVEYPKISGIEEFFYIKANKSIELSNVLSKCGTSTMPVTCLASTEKILEADTWYKISGDVIFTINSNITIQAVIGDNFSFGNKAEYKEEKIDSSKPNASISKVSTASNKAIVYENCSDTESGITKVEYSMNGGEYQNSSVFENLTPGNKYTFKVKCTNGSGLSAESEETDEIGISVVIAPTIAQYSQTPENSTYAQSRVIRITYTSENVDTPTHYYSLDGSTWIEVSSDVYDVTFTNNGYLYAKTTDAVGNTATSATYTVTNIDSTIPNASIASINTKTDRATITATCSDLESEIVKYEFSNDGINYVSTGTTASYTFTNLSQGVEYTFAVRCTNGSGLTNTASDKENTLTIVKPTISQLSQTPTNSEYAQERVIRITFDGTNISSPKYYYSLDGNTWTQVTTATHDVTFTSNGYLYAKTVDDKGNTASASTYTVENIDTSKPNTGITVGSLQTDRITVNASCSDTESGIIKYEFSSDNGSNFISNGTTSSYTFVGLNQGTEHNFVVRCTNGSGLTNTSSATGETTSIIAPTISQLGQTPSGTYATERVIGITYNVYSIAKIGGLYFKSSVDATVESGIVIAICGNGTNPDTCTSSSETSIKAGYWYKTGNTTPSVTFTSNGYLYAMTTDESGNAASAATYTIENVDASKPSTSIAVGTMYTDRTTITATCSDTESGITKYEFSNDNGSNWVNNGTASSYTFTNLNQSTEYTFVVRCTNGSGLTNTASDAESTSTIVNPTISQASATIASGYTWATERVIRITFNGTNISNPKYYYSYDGNTWTQVTSTTHDVTFTSNGYLYAKTVDDKGNTASAATYTVENTSSGTPTAPTIIGGSTNWSSTAKTISVSTPSTETSGISHYRYYIATSSSGGGGSWIDLPSGTTSVSITTEGTRYIFFRAVGNNGVAGTISAYQVTMIDSVKPTTPVLYVKDTAGTTTKGTISAESIGSVNTTTSSILTASSTDTNLVGYDYTVYVNKTPLKQESTQYASKYSRICFNVSDISAGDTIYFDFIAEFASSDVAKIGMDFNDEGITFNSVKISDTQYRIFGVYTVTEYAVTGTAGGRSHAYDTLRFFDVIGFNASNAYNLATFSNVIMYINPEVQQGTFTSSLSIPTDARTYVKVNARDNSGLVSNYTYALVTVDTSAPTTSVSSVSTKTDRATVVASCSDTISGITKYEFSSNGGSGWTSNGTTATYTFTNLNQKTSYTFAVRCTNGVGLTSTGTKAATTATIVNPTIAQFSQTPESSTYAQSRVIRITYDGTNIVNPKYYYSLDNSTWIQVTTTTKDVTFTSNGYVYAKTVDDKGNTASAATYTVTNMDTSGPSTSITIGTMYTDRTTITATCSDAQSGITKYEFSKDGGSSWTANGTTSSYTFTGLTQKTSYTFAIRCTNGSGMTNTASNSGTTATIPAPTIAQASATTASGYTWSTQKVISITFSGTNVTSPTYYFKATANTSPTVASGVVTGICGNGDTPGTCSSSTSTVLSSGYWYQTTSATSSVTFTSTGTLKAVTKDAKGQFSTITSYDVASTDNSAPSVTAAVNQHGVYSTDRITLTATCSDAESGITKYEFSSDNGSTWISEGFTQVNTTTAFYTFTGLTQNTTYNFAVRCTNGSGKTTTGTVSAKTKTITAPTIDQTSETIASGYTWATQRIVQITYNTNNVSNVEGRYFKSSVSATVPSGVVTAVCGNATNPGTCTTSSVTTLSAGYWYKTTTASPSVTYTSNGYLYAMIKDITGNAATAATYTIEKVDSTVPNAFTISANTITTSSIKLNVSTSDNTGGSGISKYAYYVNGSLKTTTSANTTITGLSASTTYSIYVISYDNAGNARQSNTINVTTSAPDTTAPTITAIGCGKQYDESGNLDYWYQKVNVTDAGGVAKVGYSTSSTTQPTSWTYTSTTYPTSVDVTVENYGTYYIWALDKNNNSSVKQVTVTGSYCDV